MLIRWELERTLENLPPLRPSFSRQSGGLRWIDQGRGVRWGSYSRCLSPPFLTRSESVLGWPYRVDGEGRGFSEMIVERRAGSVKL